MTVHPSLCQTCSKTTLLVFPRGGSIVDMQIKHQFKRKCRFMRKPTFCISKNKGLGQLPSDYEADQRLCLLRIMDSTIPLLSKSKISSFKPSSVLVHRCAVPVQKPHCWFSHDLVHKIYPCFFTFVGDNNCTLSKHKIFKNIHE